MTVRAIKFGDVLRYSLLPGLVPRTRNLVGSGFGSFAFFIALVYRAVRLLPDGHPYLNPQNIGRFGITAVVSEAARHIYFNRKQLGQNNIDQIIVFFAVIVAMLLLGLQLLLLAMSIFVPQALAFAGSFTNPLAMFDTPAMPTGVTIGSAAGMVQPFYDVAFMFLDRVFGVPGSTASTSFFGSCIGDGVANSCVPLGPNYAGNPGATVNDPATFPWPYHHGLHGIFQFYSIGLLVVAMFLLVYFTFVVVAETAQTGVPFGKRFDTLWAPLRLVTAAGLLIPMSAGLNAGQYLVLYSAMWGSNFATNGWIGFNTMLTGAGSTPGGPVANLIATPQNPDLLELAHFISVYHACKSIEDYNLIPQTAKLIASGSAAGGGTGGTVRIEPYLVKAVPSAAGSGMGSSTFIQMTPGAVVYDDAVAWSDYGDVVIRFGVQDAAAYPDEMGTVYPFCGELTIKTVCMPFDAGSTIPASAGTVPYRHEGCAYVMRYYWALLMEWIHERGTYSTTGTWSGGSNYASNYGPDGPGGLPWNIEEKISRPYYTSIYAQGNMALPSSADRNELITYGNKNLVSIIKGGVAAEQTNPTNPFGMPSDLLVRGWAVAAVWYNRIAEMNGTMTTAAWNLPKVTKYPWTMQQVAEAKATTQQNTPPSEMFNPYVQNQQMAIAFARGPAEVEAADTYWEITKWWQSAETGFTTSTRSMKTGNVVLDVINWMFGTSGLFSIRKNANVHPMAQLSSIGKSLVERSITLLGIGLTGTALQPWMNSTVGLGQAVGVLSGFAFSILSIGASAGFILYYIIPFLPFIYYFFAVAGWVKAIFEAMVGVPLWALAHIRIDGQGLPGESASAGYFLILEIMLRPILIVFGLIASISIYAASVQVLNDVFNLAVANVTGIDMEKASTTAFTLENLRGAIDTLFFTVLYVILVYMLGMSSFKLIDLIPSSMMRWLGAGITPFTDSGDGAAGQLVGYGTMGSQMAFGQLAGAAKSSAEGISSAVKAVASQKP